MTIHKARVMKETIENLGPNGMAFSVICCEDSRTIQRHTIHKAHTLSDDELFAVFTRYVKEAATDHLASERNHERALQIAEGHPGCEVCG
jgi:hypothetical protein